MKRGFTLIELMIVMILLGILATLGISSYRSSQTKSRDSKRKNDLKQIALSLEMYNNDNYRYPADKPSGGQRSGKIYGCANGGQDNQECAWGTLFANSKGTIYMTQLPKDPAVNRQYFYYAILVNGQYVGYQLYARLENTQDSDLPQSGGTPLYYQGTDCGGGSMCNYGVASANYSLTDGGHTLVPE